MSNAVVTIIKGNVVTPNGVLYGGHVVVVGDTILSVSASDVPVPTAQELQATLAGSGVSTLTVSSIEAPFVVPGFVDIHNHGVGGIDEVCDHWTVPEFSQKHLAKCGTLSTLASIIFSKTRPEATMKAIKCVEERVGQYFDDCCVIEGIHAEGPIVADCGGLPAADTEMPLDAFKKLCAEMPSMKIMTISPSKEKLVGYGRIRHLLELGVRPSLGHDRTASADSIVACMKLAHEVEQAKRKAGGASKPGDKSVAKGSGGGGTGGNRKAEGPRGDDQLHSTHIYNVMSSHHRDPSLVNFLLCDRLPAGTKYHGCVPPSVEIIADLIHVHPVAIQSIFSSRRLSDVAIISDCISLYEPGRRLKYNGRGIAVKAEGGCYLTDQHGRPTKTLAGSTVTLADQFFTLITHFGFDITAACVLLATTPARIAKIDHRVGSLKEGLKANILLMNGEMNTIVQMMVYGRSILYGDALIQRP